VASLICTRRKKELDHDHLPMQVEIHEEGPREGFQIEPGPISTADKIRLIEAQAETGLGADVVKVEPAPRGDRTRGLGGFGAGFFAAFNRNKRSLAVARRPKRSAMAPIGACDTPQTMFWIATARVKSGAVSARSRVTGVKNSPRLWRIPMPRLRSTAAPIKISRVRPELPREIVVHGIRESVPFVEDIGSCPGTPPRRDDHGLSAGIKHP
jgi:hypothetical protein